MLLDVFCRECVTANLSQGNTSGVLHLPKQVDEGELYRIMSRHYEVVHASAETMYYRALERAP